MENTTFIEENVCDKYTANEGLVITNYKAGDKQIIFSKSLLVKHGTKAPQGYYTMDEAAAKEISKQLMPKREPMEEPKDRLGETLAEMEENADEIIEENS